MGALRGADVGVAVAASAAAAASDARTAMIWVIASYGQPVGNVAGALGVVSTEIRCSPMLTKPTSCRAASLMPSGVCKRLTSAASWALALLSTASSCCLRARSSRCWNQLFTGSTNNEAINAAAITTATSANSSRLPRPLTSCLSLAMGLVNSAKRDGSGSRCNDVRAASRGR